MKKIILILIMLMIVMSGLFNIEVSAQTPTQSASNEYTVLAPLPGTTKGVCDPTKKDDPNCKTDLKTYLEGFFKLAIGLSAVVAVLMIVIGGFQYMSTDAIFGKKEGKERIKNAVFGLVLVISAWLILATINPNLLNINLNIDSVSTTGPEGTLDATPCGGCNTLDSFGLPVSSGAGRNPSVNTQLGEKLKKMNDFLKKDVPWAITEAYPPTYSGHKSACHQNGGCVDAKVMKSSPSADDLQKFLNAATMAGLKARYEVKTQNEKDTLVRAGFPASSIGVYDWVTGPHFHIDP